jgi:DNA-binding winged helix-turn-helix (wHTH) protein
MGERSPRAQPTISFGPFRLIPAKRILEKSGAPVHLSARALDILIVLVERAGQTVAKKDLIARVWQGVTVEEGSLRVHVSGLRKVLGDGKFGNRYIANIQGRGYCFVAPISHSGTLSRPATDGSTSKKGPVFPPPWAE